MEMDEVASTFKTQWVALGGAVPLACFEAGPHNRVIRRGFRRSSRRRLVVDDLCSKPVPGGRHVQNVGDLLLYLLLVLARYHAAVQEEIASIGHDVVGDASERTRNRQ